MTFEQLIRKALMDATHTALPTVALDDRNEPKIARCLITDREFDYENAGRRYHAGCTTDHKQIKFARVSADVAVTASLQIHGGETPPDVEALLALLARTRSYVWTWRGLSIRVAQTMLRSKLVKTDAGLIDVIAVRFNAPYLELESPPTIQESFFDGWEPEVSN